MKLDGGVGGGGTAGRGGTTSRDKIGDAKNISLAK